MTHLPLVVMVLSSSLFISGCGDGGSNETDANGDDGRPCLEYSLEECSGPVAARCEPRSGQRWDTQRSCFETAPAYCALKDDGCRPVYITATAPDDSCWLFSYSCDVPAGWAEEWGEPSCPYEGEPSCPGG